MKNLLKAIVASFLALLARGVVNRYRPQIVMVTGSVGKTSTKDAVAAALAPRYRLRASEKSFNSEFGVPYTILNVQNPWRNPLRWLVIFKRAFALLVLPNQYPNMLVLEVSAERPGDLAKILRIATPDAVVVTALPEVPVHVESYPNPAAVREEEFSPAYALAPGSPLIIPSRDENALEMASRVFAAVTTYGYADDADFRLESPGFASDGGRVIGMRATLAHGSEHAEIVVKGSVGKQQLVPAAAAATAAVTLGATLPEAIAALASYEPPPGRGRLFSGIHDSVLIDDTYNASPAAVEEALETLKIFPNTMRRVAVLGDMLELGRYSVAEHERIGELAAKSADVIVAIGIRARAIAAKARAELAESSVISFDDSFAAATALPALVRAGDVILIKGSQSVRTERVVEALLVDPSDISRLVRQEHEWKRR